MKIAKILLVLLIFSIFIYLRLSPIINKTVPYTYDQGRDFLKAEEIIRDKNLTFLGPTTGMAGVNHGAWWYYFLSVFYLIFNGLPIGFYLGLFFISSLSIVLFYFFLKKEFGLLPAFFYLITVSMSPYFMKNSFYVSNDMLTPMFVLLFIYSSYKLFEKKESKYLLLTGLSLGFILETELAFGIFLIPVIIISLIIFQQLNDIKKFILVGLGLFTPIIPRLLFELRNNFIQTKALLFNLTAKKDAHPLLFKAVLEERTRTFTQYWRDIFFNSSQILSLIIVSFVIYFYIFHRKTINSSSKKIFVYFLFLIICLLFILSLFYQGNFFYGYYFQGLQYLFLLIIITALYGSLKNNKTKFYAYLLTAIFVILNIISIFRDINNQKNIPLIGLRADEQIVSYFIKNTGNNDFCLRIYTPPVIPYTYKYLLSYYSHRGEIKYPGEDYKNNRCYYLIDKDPYKFRVDKWEKENKPNDAIVEIIKEFENGTILKLITLK